MPKKKYVLVLHSGGIDSTATIHFYKDLGFLVESIFVNFEQKSVKYEKRAVEKICDHYRINFQVIKIAGKKKFKAGNIRGRNLALLSAALMHSNFKSGVIAIGIHAGTDYVDCGEEFLRNVNKIFTQYTGGQVIAGAPFIKMSKIEIFQYCQLKRIPLNLTYSCENGVYPRCGKCKSCKELKKLYASRENN